MLKCDQTGSTATVVVIVLMSLALAGAAAFGFWAFSESQDYKNNVDKKVATAVNNAEAAQAEKLKKEFDELSKQPHTSYQGNPTYGNVTFSYPKTWSAHIDESNTGSPIIGYFYPQAVPALNNTTAYALRVELLSSPYSQVVKQFDGNIKSGAVKAAAYVPEKLKDVKNVQVGTRLDGEVAPKLNGAMIIVPVRDKTLKIYTLSADFLPDFNKVVLPSLTFTP